MFQILPILPIIIPAINKFLAVYTNLQFIKPKEVITSN